MALRHAPIALALLLGVAPARAEPATSEAQRAYDAHQFEAARALWMPQADAGDASAQLGLGLLYDLGQGVPRSAQIAYSWYLRAALQGTPDAEFNVAVMCDTGDGTRQSTGEAALWYARAASHSNHRAQFNLGQLYQAGDGVPRNEDVAATYFQAASVAIPAAAERLAALRKPGRVAKATASSDAVRPSPAQPSAPLTDAVVQPITTPDGDAVELVWTAPAQPLPVRFFVQLLAVDRSGVDEVFTATVEETSAVAFLRGRSGRYAWRVYSLGQDLKHYAASEWQRFEVEAIEGRRSKQVASQGEKPDRP